MDDPEAIAQFHDFCSDLMRQLLHALSDAPAEPRSFGDVEDALGWPRRRIASMLGGVARLRLGAFDGQRPYHLADEAQSASGRWEIWVDRDQADAIRAARRVYFASGSRR